MKNSIIIFTVLCLAACGSRTGQNSKAGADGKANSGTAATSDATASSANAGTANAGTANAGTAPIDTAKLQEDMNTILTSMVSGKPDTAALKKAAAHLGMTTQQMLSDSGINALYGNSNDPSVRAAGDMLKKLRDAAGLTPDKLDTLKKAADLLNSN